METGYYTLTDFENFIFEGIQYQLPSTITSLITMLEKELNIDYGDVANPSLKRNVTNDKKRPLNHIKRDGAKYNKNGNFKEIKNDDWEALRSFKITKIETKEGLDKKMSDIRILLNKISLKNYDIQKTLVLQSIHSFLEEAEKNDADGDVIDKFARNLFEVMSTNKFFSELYVSLYKEMMDQINIFRDIFYDNVQKFKFIIDEIHYIDPNVNYDGFCNYVKINDNRKAMTTFFINMVKNNVINETVILEILQYFLDKSLEYIASENKTNEIEEITENVYLIILNCQDHFSNHNMWKDNILPNIIRISQMKLKEHKSLSNRIVFKYMDIIDSME